MCTALARDSTTPAAKGGDLVVGFSRPYREFSNVRECKKRGFPPLRLRLTCYAGAVATGGHVGASRRHSLCICAAWVGRARVLQFVRAVVQTIEPGLRCS